MHSLRPLVPLLVLLAACTRGNKSGRDAGSPADAGEVTAAPSHRHDAGAGVVDLDAYLTFQRARMDAQAKKLPVAAAKAAGLEASGLTQAELREIDRLVLDVMGALAQVHATPEVADIPEMEESLAKAGPVEKAKLQQELAAARQAEAELTLKALEPLRQRYGDSKVDQVVARQKDLEQVMYFKANALVPQRE